MKNACLASGGFEIAVTAYAINAWYGYWCEVNDKPEHISFATFVLVVSNCVKFISSVHMHGFASNNTSRTPENYVHMHKWLSFVTLVSAILSIVLYFLPSYHVQTYEATHNKTIDS